MNLYILLASSGAGKSTVEAQLRITPIVSTTTRSMREGEINGIHYHFIKPEKFNFNDMAAMIQIGGNTEWKYGVSKLELMLALELNEDRIISIISSKYAKDLSDYAKSIGINVKIIYLFVSREERINRLTKRGEGLESINARLDFEDKLNIEELTLIFPDLIVINGEGTQEEVMKKTRKIKGV